MVDVIVRLLIDSVLIRGILKRTIFHNVAQLFPRIDRFDREENYVSDTNSLASIDTERVFSFN